MTHFCQSHQTERSHQVLEPEGQPRNGFKRASIRIGIAQVQTLNGPLRCDCGCREELNGINFHAAIGVEKDNDIRRIEA